LTAPPSFSDAPVCASPRWGDGVSASIETRRVLLQVCTTCRAEGEPQEPREARAGARLYAALLEARTDADARVLPVECFSVCKRPCTLSFSARGAWTYVYGDFAADADPQEILAAARLYAASPEGLIPWKERPQALKKGVVARLPPLALETEPHA
jgi:predicted metal-binding protein